MIQYFIFLLFTSLTIAQTASTAITTLYAEQYLQIKVALIPFFSVQSENGKIMKRNPTVISSNFPFQQSPYHEMTIREIMQEQAVMYANVYIYQRSGSKVLINETPAIIDEYGDLKSLLNGSPLLSYKPTGVQLLRAMIVVPGHLPLVINIDPPRDYTKSEIQSYNLTELNSKLVGYLGKLNATGGASAVSAVKLIIGSGIYGMSPGDATLHLDSFKFNNRLRLCVNAADTQAVLERVGLNNPNNIITSEYILQYPEDLNFDGLVKYNGSRNERTPILTTLGINLYSEVCAIY